MNTCSALLAIMSATASVGVGVGDWNCSLCTYLLSFDKSTLCVLCNWSCVTLAAGMGPVPVVPFHGRQRELTE